MMSSKTLALTEEKFLHTLSHDLREPARLISQFLKLVKLKTGGGLNDDAEMYLDYAISASGKMDNMIKGLSEINSVKRIDGEKSEVNMALIMSSVKSKMKRLFPSRKYTFYYEGEASYHTRKEVIEEIINELVMNAFLHSEKKDGLEVFISLEKELEGVLIEVKNNGATDLDSFWYENVFEPFKKKNKESENIGVGLTRLKMLTSRFGGNIEFKVDGGLTCVTCKVN